MITTKKVLTNQELKSFVKFPFELYKDDPYWIPPIISEEMENFDKAKNPSLEQCDIKLFLAYKDNKIVGRVAVIVNWQEVSVLEKKKTRFGWFEVIDDIDVTKALLNEVEKFGKAHNMNHIEGPMGISNLDKVGVLTEGFNELGTIISWHSKPYYQTHFEQAGLKVEKEYTESKFSLLDINIEHYTRASKMIKERYNLKVRNFTKSSQIMPYIDAMFGLFNETYNKLDSFVAITKGQMEHIKRKNISFINPEYIKFIMDKDNQMIAFSIVMPNFSQAFQKAKGRLFPFGFWHLLQARKHSKEAVFYLIGVSEKYQSKGVTAIIFEEYYNLFKERKIHTCIRTPELIDNHAIANLWKTFNPRVYKRRCTYTKLI